MRKKMIKQKKKKYIIALAIMLAISTTPSQVMAKTNITADKSNEDRKTESKTTEDNNKDKKTNKRECDSFEEYATDKLILNPKYKEVRSAVYRGLKAHDLQGTVLVGVGDEIIYAESFGKASQWDNIANTNTTRYGIASLTKSFTAASIMQLQEEGKLDVNDTIDKYFPDYKYGKDITILQLLQMRSGIIDYLNEMGSYMTVSDSKAIYDSFVENDDFKGLDEYRWSREDMLKNLYNNGLKFTPDERYSYCNTNYYMLGCIIEQASGMDYDKYITKNILEPCHMTSSNLAPRDGDAVAYMNSEGFVLSSYETLFSTGAIRSNVFDMFSWLRNLSKGNIVSKKSFEAMIDSTDVAKKNKAFNDKEQERLKKEQGDAYEAPKVDPKFVPTYYVCGLMVTDSLVSHTGYIDGFSNYMSVDLDTDVTIIILTNTSENKATGDIRGIKDDITNAVEGVLK